MAHDVAQGNLEVAEFVDQDACNAPDVHGDRPLTVAVLAGKIRALCLLLERGAWPSAPSCSPRTGMGPRPYIMRVRRPTRTASIYY